MTADEIKEAYEKYFKIRMQDKVFSDYVHSLGYAVTGLHNMLFTFFQEGCKHD